MKIGIRADGGTTIGMGHIMRTLVLAEKLRQFAEVSYICTRGESYRTGVECISNHGYEVALVDSIKDIGQLPLKNINCLITDSYAADQEYFDKVKNFPIVSGYIDDLGRSLRNVDFIVNQNLYGPELRYNVYSGTKLFLGIQFLMLRDEFADLSEPVVNKNIENIMITIGGTDPKQLTEHLINVIIREFKEICLHVVVGAGFANKDRLLGLESGSVKVYHNAKMSEMMRLSDMAISACGTTIYELAACGTPTIGIVTADNQVMAARRLNEVGLIRVIESAEGVLPTLRTLDYKSRNTMSKLGRKMVDGQGSMRLAEEIRKLLLIKSV